MSERDTYYDRNDVVEELRASAEYADHCDAHMLTQAASEIVQLRRCVRSVVDAYLLGDVVDTKVGDEDMCKLLVLSQQWYVLAQTLILNRSMDEVQAAGADNG